VSNVLSTGKSSNSSSSSKAAAGFVSFVGSVLLSAVVAFAVCGAPPEVGAPDILYGYEGLVMCNVYERDRSVLVVIESGMG
jgi:hypothetical protein